VNVDPKFLHSMGVASIIAGAVLIAMAMVMRGMS
jgi:hypothetical protein